jgi:hypothetical protein
MNPSPNADLRYGPDEHRRHTFLKPSIAIRHIPSPLRRIYALYCSAHAISLALLLIPKPFPPPARIVYPTEILSYDLNDFRTREEQRRSRLHTDDSAGQNELASDDKDGTNAIERSGTVTATGG